MEGYNKLSLKIIQIKIVKQQLLIIQIILEITLNSIKGEWMSSIDIVKNYKDKDQNYIID